MDDLDDHLLDQDEMNEMFSRPIGQDTYMTDADLENELAGLASEEYDIQPNAIYDRFSAPSVPVQPIDTGNQTGLTTKVSSSIKPTVAYENDFKNLLIYKTEDVLQINLQQFKKNLTTSNLSINSPSFDEKLAQIIFDKFINKQASSNSTEVIDSLSNLSQVPAKPQRQSSIPTSINPSSYELNQSVSSSQISNTSLEMNSQSDTLRKKNLLRTRAIDEQEGDDEDEDEDKTPTGSSFEDDQSDSLDEKNRFIDTDVETIKKSNERVDDWKTNFNLIESELTLSDHDEEEEEEECSTWL
ncbi:unnamed protein product [Rotaria sp. Silwood1]|nr:unnamed protein product [Rotaria sp. Silwood1]